MKILIAVLAVGVCVFLFIGAFLLNKNTPKPEGCIEIESECASCSNTSCNVRKEK